MDRPTSSERILRKSASAVSSTVLRPGAPVFTPFDDIAAVALTTFSSVSGNDNGRCNHENVGMRNHHCDRQSMDQNNKNKIIIIRGKKLQWQGRQESTKEIPKPDTNIQNTCNSEHARSTIKSKKKSEKYDLLRRSKTKNNRKCRQRNQHSMDKSKSKSKKTDGNDSATFPTKEFRTESQIQGDNDHKSNDELELASSLAFPALMEMSSSSSSFERHKLQQTLWNSLARIREPRKEQLQQDSATREKQEFLEDKKIQNWKNGLDRLTIHDGKRKQIRTGHRQPEFLPWVENSKEEEKKETENKCHLIKHYVTVDDNAAKSTPEMELATSDPETFNSLGKRTFDMNRLRDRWWMAVADQQRQLEHQQAEELEQQQEELLRFAHTIHEMPYDGVDENIRTNYSGDNYEECSCSSKSQNGDTHLTDLQQKVKSIASRYQTIRSEIKLLELIIEQSDDRALRDMVELSWNNENENQTLLDHVGMELKNGHIVGDQMTHFEIAEKDTMEEKYGADLVEHAVKTIIHKNHPNLLRTILSVTNGMVPINSKPLIQAAKLGHEECASILLSKQGKRSTMLFLNDVDGNTALHCCCQKNGNKDMLLTLLKQVIGNTKGKRQQLSKMVTARNKNLQTPLHIACHTGRNDLVEVFLATCKSSLLFKILSMEDIKQQTPLLCAVNKNSCDVVLSLLMWRRNHDHQRTKQSYIYSTSGNLFANNDNQKHVSQVNKAQNVRCPLVWAAKSGNLEMIDLLIQFGDQSGTFYQVTEALLALIRSNALSEIKIKGSNLLILAGGNLFEKIAYSELIDGEKETSISVATKIVSDEILRSIMSTALRLLNDQQLVRRRDPILQQQPESFFRTLESKENSEAKRTIKNALIESLFRAYSNRRLLDLSKAIVLYEQIGVFEVEYLIQLQTSLRNGKITSHVPQPKNWCFLATYRHSTSVVAKEGSKQHSFDCDCLVFAEKSLHALRLPWVQSEVRKTECFCPWMKRNAKKDYTASNLLADDALTLIANDGSRFVVHAPTVTEKSAKLASALRFAQMKREEDSFDEVINLEVAIAPDVCKLFIQHMYHGSICFGWPNLKDNEMCRYLLELMLIAEEFLIPSLVQEIEMRLMSLNPKRCFCWDCCQGLRGTSSDNGKIEAQCLYLINGKSCLVNRDTAMDVLSLTKYMGGLDYDIFLVPIILDSHVERKKLWANYDEEVRLQIFWKVNKALQSLRDIAIITILNEFAYVVESPDFYLTIERNISKESQKQILLRICLDELRNNSAITVACSRPNEKAMSTNAKDRSHFD